MKRQVTGKAIAAVVVSLAIPAAMGSTIVLNVDPVNFSSTSGGEFNAQVTGSLGGQTPAQILGGYAAVAKTVVNSQTGFQTFCLEESESFTPGKSYNVAINDRAVSGGANASHPGVTPGADILSVGTTWLYSQFAQGTLAGYNYTLGAGRVASAHELQATLWYLEDETTVAPANAFMTAVYGNFADPKLDAAAGLNGVHALNVTLRDGALRQDVLIYTAPDGGLTVTLLGFGLATMGVLGLRVKKN